MNDIQGQTHEMFMDKNVTARELPEIVVCDYKELTYNVVKDVCVDEDTAKVNVNPLESKSSEESKFEECVDTKDSNKLCQDNFIVTEQDFGCEKSLPSDVVATSGSVCKEALTLGDIISMEESQNLPRNNINGREESAARETEQEETEELKADNLRYFSSEMAEPKNPLLNDVLEDSDDHQHLFSGNLQNRSGESTFSEGESGLAHITYSGTISVSGSNSVRSDGSTVSSRSFAFPILQSEWNSSPVRMAKAEKRPMQIRKKKGWRHYSLLLCCRF
uniref:18S pre-ribosomal assembly protein gar2-like protein n=1 Tax=Noccaea caerulescens TaxID=107243 RepID=A0A1J3FRP4_NOCCA